RYGAPDGRHVQRLLLRQLQPGIRAGTAQTVQQRRVGQRLRWVLRRAPLEQPEQAHGRTSSRDAGGGSDRARSTATTPARPPRMSAAGAYTRATPTRTVSANTTSSTTSTCLTTGSAPLRPRPRRRAPTGPAWRPPAG